ncbi:MAG: DNA/RNA nuclease SfsA [bacterium JZ-2024 1]
MRWEHPLKKARFLRRVNRFTGEVRLEGRVLRAHIPNSSHLRELLIPPCAVYLLDNRTEMQTGKRKTPFTILLVRHRHLFACVDAHMPNRLFREAWAQKALPMFSDYRQMKPEVRIAGERLDFELFDATGKRAVVEVKSCTLVENGIGWFPDPATARGVRHLKILQKLAQKGVPSYLLFFIQRSDAKCLRPNEKVDPDFACEMKTSAKMGVHLHAFTCKVSLQGIKLFQEVPVYV